MQRSREYWQERFLKLEQAVHDFAEDIFKDISDYYALIMQGLERDITAWYQRYAYENDMSYAEAKKLLNSKEMRSFKLDIKSYMKVAELAGLSEVWQKKLNNYYTRMRVSRLEALQLMVQQHLEVLFGNQLDSLDNRLLQLYTEGYYNTVFNIQQGAGVGTSFTLVDTKKLDAVLAKPWASDGRNFSSRIWEHKDNLVGLLNIEITQAVIRGDDYSRVINTVARKMNVSRANAGRLVMTEAAFIGTKAQQDCFKELEVEQYEFIATLDKRTSEICREMDGKVFKLSDMKIGTNAPPLHPHCRSCTAPYFDDAEDLERTARSEDGKTYKVPADMSYKDWKEKYVPNYSEKSVQQGNKNVIINIENTAKVGVGSPECDLDYIRSESYRRKFDSLSDNPALNSAVCARCRAILTHQNGKLTEDLVVLKVSDGALVGSTSGKKDYEAEYSEKLKSEIAKHRPFELISIHNHGTNLPPSGSDFGSAGYRKYAFGVVACHDGKVFKYSVKNAKPFITGAIDDKIERLKRNSNTQNIYQIVISVLNEFVKSYGIEWGELK